MNFQHISCVFCKATHRFYLAFILGFILLNGIKSQTEELPFRGLVVNDDLPKFTVKDTSGKVYDSTKDLQGKVLVVNFWATWAAPTLPFFKKAQVLADSFRHKDLVFLFVNIESDTTAWLDFLRTNPDVQSLPANRFIHVNDNMILPINFMVTAIPNIFIIGRNGKIAYNSRFKLSFDFEVLLKKILESNQ